MSGPKSDYSHRLLTQVGGGEVPEDACVRTKETTPKTTPLQAAPLAAGGLGFLVLRVHLLFQACLSE